MARKLSALRTFFKYLQRRGVLEQNPARLAPTPKADKPLPRFLTVDEVFHLLDRVGGETSFPEPAGPGHPGVVLFRRRASVGVGRPEMADLDLDEGLVRVWGKGAKERLAFLGKPALVALKGLPSRT
jgi:integrase/recombinase XerC